jgi:transposase
MGGEERRYKRYEQDQGALFPAYLSEGLDQSDPAFFINDVVDSLELEAFEQRYSRLGERSYSPRMLLKVWLYAATQGVYSGREIARKLRRDLGFRYLAGEGPYPDFRTINRFRIRHQNDFAWMLLETIELAREAGLGKLGIVAIDGTKVRANTSRHKAMSYGRMRKEEKRLKREILAILAKMDEVNAQEDEEHGENDDGSGGLPEELQDKKQRLARIEELRGQLEAERGDRVTDKSQKSFADPDAQMMKTSDGALTYAYNAQAAVSEDGLIVATGHTTDVNDMGQLIPMVDEVERNTGESAGTVLADNGYLTEKNLQTLRDRGQKCLVAVAREFRRPSRWPKGAETRRMHLIQRLPWAKRLYGRRKTQGERQFAEIKQAMGFRRHALRGRAKTAGEWDLVAAAYNLRRLYVLGQAMA